MGYYSKLWISLDEDDPKLFSEWEADENIDVCSCLVSGSGLIPWSLQARAFRVTKELLKRVPVDMPDVDGETPLQVAAALGNLVGMNQLLAAGANINHQANNGKTALMLAVERKRPACVKQLLAKGADTSIRDNTGRTVHAYARTDMLRLLEPYTSKEAAVKVVAAKTPVKKTTRERMKI